MGTSSRSNRAFAAGERSAARSLSVASFRGVRVHCFLFVSKLHGETLMQESQLAKTKLTPIAVKSASVFSTNSLLKRRCFEE